MTRVAVYNRFWYSQGGGERHSGMLAQVLAAGGAEVDLLGHVAVDRDELADHLGLDLSRCAVRVVPDRGDEHLARTSAGYDLFVNATYMSRLAPRARRNAYLCYFPTPFDHDMSSWRRWAVRTLGPRLRRVADNLDFGLGWFPPEGGRRRQWTWTSGDGVLTVPAGGPRWLRFDLGAPGLRTPLELEVVGDDGGTLLTTAVTEAFREVRLELPPLPDGCELRFRSATRVPGEGDDRTLGVAISRPRLQGVQLGLRERLAFRYPWLLRDPADLSFLEAYDCVLANSSFTQGWVERLWHVQADLLFPPIQVDRISPRPQRDKAILSIGRFFAPGLGHAKRQLEMVQLFGELVRGGHLEGWVFHVVGGCEPSQEPYLAQVRAAAAGLPVEVHPNAPRSLVEQLLSSAAVFWSATGYGEDPDRAPWASEHFGMTTVEAMAGGCVPVVIDLAGQREIVRDGVEGFRWSTPAQLHARTLQVAGDEALRARLSAAAVARAQDFSEAAFAEQLHGVVRRHGLLGG